MEKIISLLVTEPHVDITEATKSLDSRISTSNVTTDTPENENTPITEHLESTNSKLFDDRTDNEDKKRYFLPLHLIY